MLHQTKQPQHARPCLKRASPPRYHLRNIRNRRTTNSVAGTSSRNNTTAQPSHINSICSWSMMNSPAAMDADVETGSSSDINDYETASESDRPYTYARTEDGMDVEVCSVADEMDSKCPDAGFQERKGISYVETDAGEYDKEAEEAMAAAAAPEALIAWLNDEDQPTSDLDTDDGAAGLDGAPQDDVEGHAKAVKAADKAALDQILHYQRTSHNLLPAEGFKQLVNSILQNHPGFAATDRAVKALQASAEDFLVTLLEDANLEAVHAGRQKLQASDIRRAWRVRDLRTGTAMQHTITEQWDGYS